MEKRPTGISILAVAYIILAILSLLWSGLVFGVGGLTSLFGGLFGADAVSAFGVSSGWSGFVGIVEAVVQGDESHRPRAVRKLDLTNQRVGDPLGVLLAH